MGKKALIDKIENKETGFNRWLTDIKDLAYLKDAKGKARFNEWRKTLQELKAVNAKQLQLLNQLIPHFEEDFKSYQGPTIQRINKYIEDIRDVELEFKGVTEVWSLLDSATKYLEDEREKIDVEIKADVAGFIDFFKSMQVLIETQNKIIDVAQLAINNLISEQDLDKNRPALMDTSSRLVDLFDRELGVLDKLDNHDALLDKIREYIIKQDRSVGDDVKLAAARARIYASGPLGLVVANATKPFDLRDQNGNKIAPADERDEIVNIWKLYYKLAKAKAMTQKLTPISDESFWYHLGVNNPAEKRKEDKKAGSGLNDFAVWIRHQYNDLILANQINSLRTAKGERRPENHGGALDLPPLRGKIMTLLEARYPVLKG